VVYQEEGQIKLKRLQAKQAIALAMGGRWQEAVALNKDIIENFPNDVDAYNRLGRAYIELGDFSQARAAYSRTMELDPYNAIARKNLRRLSLVGEHPVSSEEDADTAKPQHFIEETGKAGVVNLHNLASGEILARTVAGDRVYLRINNSTLIVEDSSGQYLGEVGPKHGQRLIRLMKGGNEYSAAIVSSTEDKVAVIIREVSQHPSQAGRHSFPPRSLEGPQPYVSDRILRRGLEYEGESADELGYTIVGGEETEIVPDEYLEVEEEEG
jgi:hypothetical protein